MKIPLLSKVLMIVHAAIALLLFLSVLAYAGGYQNGVQWALIAWIDFPVCYPLQFIPERIFNPALVSESKLNWIYLTYTITIGSIYWYLLGWLGNFIYSKFRKPGPV
jgi:hypothetical protein